MNSLQNKIMFAVQHPLNEYVVIAVNLTGDSQSLKHVNASVLFSGLVYGSGTFDVAGFGFPIGLTILPNTGKYILVSFNERNECIEDHVGCEDYCETSDLYIIV